MREIKFVKEMLEDKLSGNNGFGQIQILSRPSSYTRAYTTYETDSETSMTKKVVKTRPFDYDYLELTVSPEFVKKYGKYYNFSGYHVYTVVKELDEAKL